MLYSFGNYTLHTTRYELRRGDTVLRLEPQVFAVLAYLVQHAERVVSKPELLEHLWPNRYVSDKALVRCIQHLRRVLGDAPQTPSYIQTLYGRGYRFTGAVVQYVHAPPEAPALSHLAAQDSPTSAMLSPALPQPRAPLLHPDGERKQVTVLVGVLDDAPGLAASLGDEVLYQLMQGFMVSARRAIQRDEGTLTECRGNGLVALFGALLACEDHAPRAGLAALALQQCLREHTATLSLPYQQTPRCPFHTFATSNLAERL